VMYIKCKKSLYKSTYQGYAFREGRFYLKLNEDKNFVYMKDERDNSFNFATDKTTNEFYKYEDYFNF
jgi:hypothetical protein